MSLASKYRPKTFDDVVEQDIVVDIIQKMCEQPGLPNRNFLLIGTRGSGKTTLGRCIARKLNGGNGSAIELDAASNGSIDAVRDIVEQAKQYPVSTPYKVFILDEIHSLSNAAFQVLLLTLEAQPAKSVFIMLTTNPEKIPATILSRIQVFRLNNISVDGIAGRLKYVLDSEKDEGRDITYDDDAILYIAKRGRGSMRDALTLLDKALIYSGDVTMDNLRVSLHIPDFDSYFDLLGAYVRNDHADIMRIVGSINDSGTDLVQWFKDFQSFAVNLAKYISLGDLSKTTIPSYYEDRVRNYDHKHAQACLKLSQ